MLLPLAAATPCHAALSSYRFSPPPRYYAALRAAAGVTPCQFDFCYYGYCSLLIRHMPMFATLFTDAMLFSANHADVTPRFDTPRC